MGSQSKNKRDRGSAHNDEHTVNHKDRCFIIIYSLRL